MDGSMSALFSSAVWISIRAVLPILAAAMIVGLVIGILQTATSVQEQTLSFVPKILVVVLTSLFLGPTLFKPIWKMTVDILGNLNSFVK